VILFSNCKINLGLHITRKRSDAYHDIETIFFPVPVNDVLEIMSGSDSRSGGSVNLSLTGIPIPGTVTGNLIVVAYKLLKKDFPNLPPIHFHLHKMIPPGAGLGAGSANGAFALKGLNDKYDLGLSEQQLIDYAAQIGSDTSFFIINEPCYATGRGEKLERIPLDLSDYKLIIVNPGLEISTAWAFAYVIPMQPEKSLKDIIAQPISTWRKELYNDFETTVFRSYPQIEKIKTDLYEAGAVYASMSGSGSTVYGLFPKDSTPALSFPTDYFQKTVSLGATTI
jgi:4-diphosphocytidyl-2-C-methyl-D-erythritol kinase